MLQSLQQQHLAGILGYATQKQLKGALSNSLTAEDFMKMGDYRFRGYVNDFMVSPRNPITVDRQSLPHGKTAQGADNELHASPPQPTALSQSADLRERKAEAEREIAAFKQEKLNQLLKEEEERRLRKQNSDSVRETPRQRVEHYPAEQAVRDSDLERAMADTQARIERLEHENTAMNSIPYIDPVGGQISRPPVQQKPFEFYDPWGKGQGNPRRRADGNLESYVMIKDYGIPEPRMSPIRKEKLKPDSLAQRPHSDHYDSERYHVERGSNLFSQMRSADNVGTGLNTSSRYGGGGAAVKSDSGKTRTRFPITMKRDENGVSSMTELDGYNPFKGRAVEAEAPGYFQFGKPGAGAPLRDRDGKLHLTRRNIDFAHELDSSADVLKRRRAAEVYLKELKKEMSDQKRTREEANVDSKAPIGELASVLRQGKVGYPKRDPETGNILDHKHQFTDITKVKAGIPESRKYAGVVGGDDLAMTRQNAQKYHTDLSRLADERHRKRQIERSQEREDDRKHEQRWNEFWGKPGAGAPLSTDPNASFRRPKFEQMLHQTDSKPGLMYVKNTPVGIKELHPAHYLRSTIDSNHNNMFELPVDGSRFKPNKGEYKLVTPFATL